jgi:histidinol phosphatase-like enzyme (inositol monophosphatase family)
MTQDFTRFIFSIQSKLKKINSIKLNSYKSKKKSKTDPVTKSDILIEKFIRSKIRSKFPNHTIFGEELIAEVNNKEFEWYIDPIDGTKNYLMGLPTWSNLIGLYKNGKPLIGFANFPDLNKFYFSDSKKSFLVKNKNKKLIKSSKNTNFNKLKIAINTFNTIKIKKIYNFFKNYKGIIKITGCDAYNFCSVAEGKIDALIEAGLKKIDVLPLVPIIDNSGAIITNWKGQRNFSEGKILVSGNKKLHGKLLKIIS